MSITINIPTALRQFTDGHSSIEVDATTTAEALNRLTSLHAGLRRHLYDDKNALRSFVNIYLNDEDIRYLDNLQSAVKDGDTLSIIPAVAGG